MKKIFYSLMTVAALLTAASCQKEFTNSPDPALSGRPVVTTFNVDLGVATKAVESSTLDDGTLVNKLYVAVYGSDSKLVSTSSLIGSNAAAISNKTATVKLTLSKGQSYDIVFFAMCDDAYDVQFADGPTATFSYKSGAKANDPKLDAFYKKVSVASASTTSESVTLKRPFAQINVLSSTAPDGNISSSMTVKQVPTTFDLFNEAAGTTLSDLAFADNAISAAAFGKYANSYTWLAMNFVLPNANGLVELSFQATDMEKALTIKNVAVKKNGRTNLIGDIYALKADITYTVTVDPIFGEEGEGNMDDDETEITVADGTTYNANNPLVIDVSNSADPVSVTLNVNNGDSFSVVEEGADGGVVEASSDNEEVATATVDKANNAVKITPVGDGTANITVTTPRYTKAGFSAGSIVIPVEVTGFGPGGGEEDPMAATKTETLPYEESLTGGQGDFKIYDAVKPEGLTAVWTQNSSNGMVAKAYADNTNYATESWLYTEDIDLGNATAPTLTFSHCARYLGAIEDVSLWIRESEGEWQSLAFSANVENGSSWKWVDNEIDLTAFKGKKIQIAFKYTSSDTAAGTYEVKNFKVEDASGPIETTISFAKESLTLTVGSSATNAVTTNSTGAKTFTSSNESVAEVDETGKVTAKAAGSATITVSIAADGRYTAASDSYPVTVNAASGDTAPVGTVLWEETWAGATDGQLLDAYEFGGTTVFGGKTVSYSYVGGTKIYKDNQMDGSTAQENLMLGKKANDVSGTWGISGIPTGKASKAILTIYTNNANTFKSDLVTLTSSTSGVTIKDKTQGTETAKPFSFTFEIEFGTVTTFDLLFTNGYSQNVRIDDITLTVAD